MPGILKCDAPLLRRVELEELQEALKPSPIRSKYDEEVARLRTELKRELLSRDDSFWQMHAAWCTEGRGKDDAGSAACLRWREHASKTEL